MEITKKRPTFIKAKERVSHNDKKLETAKKTLQQAVKANEAHQADIRKLEEELQEVENSKAEWEATVAGQSQSRGSNVHLEEAQVILFIRQYFKLHSKILLTFTNCR